jgi:hypothetical protein
MAARSLYHILSTLPLPAELCLWSMIDLGLASCLNLA